MNQDKPAAEVTDLQGVQDELDETLVAYLDGQLESTECEAIESRIAGDAALRSRITELDRVWNALDNLPRSSASEAFTRSTVEMAAVAAAPGARRGRRSVGWRRWLWSGLAGLGGILAGGLMTATVVTAPERARLGALPTAMHAAALEHAGSIDFLRQLSDEAGPRLVAVSDSNAKAQADSLNAEAQQWAELSAAIPPERRAWVEHQNASTLAVLNEQLAEWQGRSDTQRDALELFAREIATASDAEQLRLTAIAYGDLVEQLPVAEQSRLRQLPPDERLTEVLEGLDSWHRRLALELTDAQSAAFRAAVTALVASEGFRADLDSMRQQREIFARFPRLRPELAFEFITRGIARSAGAGSWLRGADVRERGAARRVSEAWQSWVDKVAVALPPPAKSALEESPNLPIRARAVLHLLRQGSGRGDLASAFAKVDDLDMERLLLLPEEEFLDRLSSESPDSPTRPEGRRPPLDKYGPSRAGERPLPGGRPPRRSDQHGGRSDEHGERRPAPPRNRLNGT